MKNGIRTDLALEARQLWREEAGQAARLEGVRARQGRCFGLPVTRVQVLDERGEKALGKEKGVYITLELEGLERREKDVFSRSARALAQQLQALPTARVEEGCVLVVGLGNRAITPDCVGPKVCDRLLVTRHLLRQMPRRFEGLRPVAALAPGVLGSTGLESGETVLALCRAVEPALVIAVDALACRGVERLCRTIQLTDTGVAPGSGVGNRRWALNRENLGVPVVAVGVPTVVDGATLAADLTGREVSREGPAGEMLVTPRDIDSQAEQLAKVIAWGLNLALQPGLEPEELELLLE